jgi:hypothetical protein
MSLIQQLGIIAGTVTALAGSVGAVLALGNDGPPPRSHPPRATLTIERFEKSVTRGQFAARYPEQAPKHLTPAQRERLGGVAELHIVFHNFEGRRCALSWTMFDGANDSPLGDPEFVRRPAGEFKLHRPLERFAPFVWVPAPEVDDVYVVFSLAEGEHACNEPVRSELLATG